MRGVLAVCFLTAACNGKHHINQQPDAPAFQDAPDNDAAVSPVRLTITLNGAGSQGIHVYFQNADSSVVSAAMTDANGVASAVMVPGGFVTAVNPFGPPDRVTDIRTFAGVKPGDKLVLDQSSSSSTVVNVNLTLPIDGQASAYTLFTPCTPFGIDVTDTDGSGGGSGPGGPLQLFGCGATGATTDAIVVTTDAATGQQLRSIHEAGVALVDQGTLDLSGAAPYVANDDVTFSYTNVPATAASINVDSVLVDPHGIIFDLFTSATLTGGAATTTPVKRPPDAGALEVTNTTFFGGNFANHHVIEWGAPTTAYTLNLPATAFLGSYSQLPDLDFANHQLSWMVDAGGLTSDFVIANTSYFRDLTTTTQSWRWQIAAPGGGTTITLPVLPAPDDVFNPITNDGFNTFELTTVKVPGGYDAVRNDVLLNDGSQTGLVLGASGQAIVEDLQLAKVRKRLEPARVVPRWLKSAR